MARKPWSKKPGPPPGTRPPGGGRKEIPLDWERIGKMIEAGCLGTEIAATFNCHPDTLYNRCYEENGLRYSDFSREKKYKGDGSLRIKQFQEAMNGDRGMLIWLGKQRIGQKENPEQIEEFNGKLGELLDMLKKMEAGRSAKDK